MSTAPKRPTVNVLGLGYIGLPTASLLATRGYQVHGVDVSPEVVATINQGDIHIVEPELDVLVRSAVHSGQLTAATEPAAADVFLIAVPTPFKDGKQPDLSYVEAATRSMAQVLEPGNLVILESTSPVGTTERVAEWIAAARPDLSPDTIHIAHCPERVLPGRIIQELVDNDRVVGGLDDASTEAAADFYRAFVSGEVLPTTARTAEMAKLTENTFRDVNIALANELSLICNRLNIDVWRLIELANRHPRVNVLQPGPGVGGHCIAVDPWFIIDSAPEQAQLIHTARTVNDAKPDHVVAQVVSRAERLRDPVIACLGLAYKPDVDDLRESPALRITESLAESGVGRILAIEPYAESIPNRLEELGAEWANLQDAMQEADILVALVAHRPFRNLSAAQVQAKMVVDACGLLKQLG
ncbi:UDP-N-acetyl-D-mannosamine dehydrogenase [Halorhodospira halochloris]|uniref:UDP-N-acetyl-D-mannosamine dehydrogenase n=1 Tax=Halorhodospira halochloris TaxID=1052 RepID=UPI001EE8AC11|nr:UDP-N-acetyl-D-mannosamine dehydrogenase [Halorhodospira halochloris]MCG5548920.1 UDP-N-acetyl-D-mannosamine dehydrogenase [Halorhodospira halochloris]